MFLLHIHVEGAMANFCQVIIHTKLHSQRIILQMGKMQIKVSLHSLIVAWFFFPSITLTTWFSKNKHENWKFRNPITTSVYEFPWWGAKQKTIIRKSHGRCSCFPWSVISRLSFYNMSSEFCTLSRAFLEHGTKLENCCVLKLPSENIKRSFLFSFQSFTADWRAGASKGFKLLTSYEAEKSPCGWNSAVRNLSFEFCFYKFWQRWPAGAEQDYL